MSVYKPQGSPYFYWEFQFKGHRFYGRTGTTNREEAKAIEAVERSKVVRGEHFGTKDEMTVDIALGRYFTEVAASQTTADTTLYQFANLGRLLGADTLLSRISDKAVSALVARRRGEPSRNGGLLANSSVNREIELLRRMMYRARDVWGAAIGTVNWKAQKLKEPPPRERTLREDEETRLIDAAADHLKPAIRFSLLTGLRLGNTVNLDWSEVDLQRREMSLTVKGDKPLVLPITDAMLVLLANQGPHEHGPVFTYKGRAIKTWKTAWKGAKRRAGITDFRWHDLRHTVGSRMVACGEDISVVQEVFGHSDISTTRRYVHHKQDAKRRALEALASQDITKAETGSGRR